MSTKGRVPVFCIASLAIVFAFSGCGDESNGGDSGNAGETEKTQTSADTSKPSAPVDTSGEPIVRNTELKGRLLARTREAKIRAAGCFRAAGVRAATDPQAVESIVIKRARGITLRLSWASGGGADVYFGGTPANVRRTRASLPEDAPTFRKGTLLVLDSENLDSTKRAMLVRCL
jgi:hypothetical protein